MRIIPRPGCRNDLGGLAWVTDRRHRILSRTIRVLSQDPVLDARLDPLLAPFARTDAAARLRHTFHVTDRPEEGLRAFNECRRLAAGDDPTVILSGLISGINRVVVEALTLFAVHSGVVQHGERVLAFPARTGEGKTTLTAACLLSGFDYISDEALVLDDDGNVVVYPKPLALTEWSCETLGLNGSRDETLFTAVELGAGIGSGGLGVTDIVISEYGSTGETLVELPHSQGVAALLSHSFNHYKDPERAFRLATSVADRARVWRLEYDDPLQAAKVLRETLT